MMYENVYVTRSSNIERLAFIIEDKEDFVKDEVGTLRIGFASGGVYDYEEVTYEVFQELKDASSMGKFYHRNIKGKYESCPVINGFEEGLGAYENVRCLGEIVAEEDLDEEFFTELKGNPTDRVKTGDFLVITEFFGEKVIKEKEILEYINSNKKTSMKIYRIGECVIDF